MSREYTHLELHPGGRVDPDKSTIKCEAPGCKNTVLLAHAYSFVVVFATTGPKPIPAFQCDEEQHFACSPDCAKAAAIVCINEHLLPAHKALEDAA